MEISSVTRKDFWTTLPPKLNRIEISKYIQSYLAKSTRLPDAYFFDELNVSVLRIALTLVESFARDHEIRLATNHEPQLLFQSLLDSVSCQGNDDYML